jgi:hypothetical protein
LLQKASTTIKCLNKKKVEKKTIAGHLTVPVIFPVVESAPAWSFAFSGGTGGCSPKSDPVKGAVMLFGASGLNGPGVEIGVFSGPP